MSTDNQNAQTFQTQQEAGSTSGLNGVMAQRGRQPGFVMSEAHRVKIQNSNILNALVEHVEGKREMTSTQVSAGIALLKKVMPDMQSVQHEGTGEGGAFPVALTVKFE